MMPNLVGGSSAANHCAPTTGRKHRPSIDQLRIAVAVLKRLPGRAKSFFHTRCLVGFPWFWPSKPLGNQAMVHARHIVRRHYGRNYHPVHRVFARGLVTIVWPL